MQPSFLLINRPPTTKTEKGSCIHCGSCIFMDIFIVQPINQWERIYRTKGGCANIIIHYWKQKISFFFFLFPKQSRRCFDFLSFHQLSITATTTINQPTDQPSFCLVSFYRRRRLFYFVDHRKKIYLVGVLIHTAGFSFGDFFWC